MKTRTGGFPLGFRRGDGAWQKDPRKLIAWMKENDVAVIDLGRDAGIAAEPFIGAGIGVGSIVWRTTKV